MQVALVPESLKKGATGARFEEQDVFDVFFKAAVFAQQVAQVTVEKTVLPDEFKKRVQEKPSLFDIAHVGAGRQNREQLGLILFKERGHQLVFGGEVVVKVAWADGELRGDQGGGDIGLAKAVEERQGGAQDALRSSARGFFSHGRRYRVVVGRHMVWGFKTLA